MGVRKALRRDPGQDQNLDPGARMAALAAARAPHEGSVMPPGHPRPSAQTKNDGQSETSKQTKNGEGPRFHPRFPQ